MEIKDIIDIVNCNLPLPSNATDKVIIKEIIVECLKKQIPYKPTINKLLVGVGRCRCGAEFLDKNTNNCGNCGQMLDWSEQE